MAAKKKPTKAQIGAQAQRQLNKAGIPTGPPSRGRVSEPSSGARTVGGITYRVPPLPKLSSTPKAKDDYAALRRQGYSDAVARERSGWTGTAKWKK